MQKFDLDFSQPLMNAAGTLGFTPDLHGPVDLSRFGAFITNPISLEPRSPARPAHVIRYPGGFLLHTGYPNPGLKRAIRAYAARWRRAPLPVIVHLLAPGGNRESFSQLGGMVRSLEPLENVIGVELGLPPDLPPEAAPSLAQAASGELAMVLRFSIDQAASLAGLDERFWRALEEAGVSAVSLGPPYGALPVVPETAAKGFSTIPLIQPTLPVASETTAKGAVARGRLYGPGLFPQALATVQKLAQCGLPVIGGCGVYAWGQVEAMLAAGATAVQLDGVLWRGYPPSEETGNGN